MTEIRHHTASAVVLDNAGRMLLVHHNKIGQWLYAGGHIDPNEDPAQATVREVREETGIQATVIGEPAFAHPSVRSHPVPWAIIEMDVADSRIGAHRHIDLVYVCRTSGGDLAAQLEEVSGVRWVPVSGITDLQTRRSSCTRRCRFPVGQRHMSRPAGRLWQGLPTAGVLPPARAATRVRRRVRLPQGGPRRRGAGGAVRRRPGWRRRGGRGARRG